MENTPKKRRFRLNLFDVIFIAVVVIAAFLVLRLSGGGDGVGGIISSSTQEPVVYTIMLQEMYGDTARLIQPGDELVDKIENRLMGTVVSVEVTPAIATRSDSVSGVRINSLTPGHYDATIVVEATATVTDNQISIGGFTVRAGTWISVNGPLYNGNGFIIDIERDGAA